LCLDFGCVVPAVGWNIIVAAIQWLATIIIPVVNEIDDEANSMGFSRLDDVV
jgi:hypothetical protein